MQKQYVTLQDLYLTFLTHNDSFMKKVPKGEILTLINGDLHYAGYCSIDDVAGYLHHKFIKEMEVWQSPA